MSQCTRAKLLTVFLRFLTVAFVSYCFWKAAEPLADYFSWNFTSGMALGLALLGGAISLLATWRLFDFTQDCFSVPDSMQSSAKPEGRRQCRRGVCEVNLGTKGEAPGRASPMEAYAINEAVPAKGRQERKSSTTPAISKSEIDELLRDIDSIEIPAVKSGGSADLAQAKALLCETRLALVELKPESPGSMIVEVRIDHLRPEAAELKEKLLALADVQWSPRDSSDDGALLVGRVLDRGRGELVLAGIQETVESFS